MGDGPRFAVCPCGCGEEYQARRHWFYLLLPGDALGKEKVRLPRLEGSACPYTLFACTGESMAVGTVLFLVPLEGVVEGCVYKYVLASLLCMRIQ